MADTESSGEVKKCIYCRENELTGKQRLYCSSKCRSNHWLKRFRGTAGAPSFVGSSEEMQSMWRDFLRFVKKHEKVLLKEVQQEKEN